MSMSMQTPGLSSGSRNIHTFVPLPRTSSSDSLMTHGGLPSHMVLNPEPHLRQIPHPRIMNPMREDVHPNPDDISTSSVRPISSSSTTGPFSRPDSSQVLWLLQDNMSAPVQQLILHPSPIPALPTIQNAAAPVQIHLKLLRHRLSLNRKLKLIQTMASPGLLSLQRQLTLDCLPRLPPIQLQAELQALQKSNLQLQSPFLLAPAF